MIAVGRGDSTLVVSDSLMIVKKKGNDLEEIRPCSLIACNGQARVEVEVDAVAGSWGNRGAVVLALVDRRRNGIKTMKGVRS